MFTIIGEKINGTRKSVGAAILDRDAAFIASLARRQADAGAHWIDINAGTHPGREADDLAWLVEIVQANVEVPLSLDSANPRALAKVLPLTTQTPLINSITLEPARLDGILPLAVASGSPVIALAIAGGAMPATVEDRVDILLRLMEVTRDAGIPDDRVYLDPLVMTIATNTQCGVIALETIRRVRAEFPDAHITSGLSNVSYGLPVRGLINRTYLSLAMAAGLDAAIVDPLDRELKAALLATELLLGQDRHCLAYTRAFRQGLLEAPQPVAATV